MDSLPPLNFSDDFTREKPSRSKIKDDMASIGGTTLADNASCMVTFVPLRTSTAKPTVKKPLESTKKLKKKLSQISEENDNLTKQIDEKNNEIDDLKRSVQSLNDVLQSVPLDQIRADTSIATKQILELSKKNRQLRTELDSKKLLINKRDLQIQKLEKEVHTLADKLESDKGDAQKGGNALTELQMKFNNLQQKWFETRNKNVELQEKLKLAGKCLQQEIGDSFDLSKLNTLAAQNTCNFRGRAQQILHLQQTITELKARMEMLENMTTPAAMTSFVGESADTLSMGKDENGAKCKSSRSMRSAMSFDRIAPSVRRSEIMHRAKVDELEKTIGDLRAQLEEQRGKILALKVRNKTLNDEMIKYKTRANLLMDGNEFNGMNMAAMNEQIHVQKYEYETRIENISHELKELKQNSEASKIREEELRTKLENAVETLAQREASLAEAEKIIDKLEKDMKAICGDFLFSCRELRKEEFVAILDSLESEKNYLLEQNKTLNDRLNEERIKIDNLTEAHSKQKIRNARLEGKVRDLEKELENNGEKKKRLQRISDYTSNLSAKNGSLSSFIFESSHRSSSTALATEEFTQQINEFKNQLEFANEKIAILEDRLAYLTAEKEKDVAAFEQAIANSRNAILDTILSYRGEQCSMSGGNSVSCVNINRSSDSSSKRD